jgi:beta-glucanase (GH16 family)
VLARHALPVALCVAAMTLVGVALPPVGATDAAAAKKPRIKLPTSKDKRWKLIHASEFSDPGATFKNWLTQRDDWIKGGVPYSNLEGLNYSGSNVSVSDGALNLAVGRDPADPRRLTTGSVNGRHKLNFRYGYLEARMLVPVCAGCWPGFWLLPKADHWPPEIDIFEYVDTEKMRYPWSAVHWPDSSSSTKERYISKKLSPKYEGDYTGRWQTYGMLWDAKSVRVYLNGRLGASFRRAGAIPRLSMYPIIHLAVGAGRNPAVGSTMKVDYVRLWQQRKRR